ncbi:TonB-dependent receptor plug domain-containing protein [Porphyromonadaceae bacterium W3.11]|nr:TonB-dependent receptor plug domain-containing protein [Porphyromonadaceae bacterium W3.11]
MKFNSIFDRRELPVLLFLIGLWLTPIANAQSPNKVDVYGTIYELDGNDLLPLGFAAVSFPDYAIGTTTKNDGSYLLKNVPVGKARIRVQFLGKLQIDAVIDVQDKMDPIDFTMKNEDFKIKEIIVTAQRNQAGKSTSSKIARTAIDHIQATSLFDLMALIPGGLSSEPNLDNNRQINIRQVSDASKVANFNALGTAIIKDGAPVSNNSNLQAMNPTVNGMAEALSGGASPTGGLDVRSIGTENIESIEIIRGIPSVEYGDLTSGAVIINAKAGREPLRINAKANPKVYQASLTTGFALGVKNGALNLSGDYAYNTSNPTQSYRHYQRASARVMYSNVLFNNKLRSNTSISFIYGKDQRDRNPDDEITQTISRGEDRGGTLNSNGSWSIDKGWLKNIRYVVSGTYTSKNSYYQQVYSSANAPYSMTTTDGAILSNVPGRHVHDADGNEITHFGSEDMQNYAIYLPSSYLGHYNIDSKEVNFYAKLVATFFKKTGVVNNRIMSGIDFRSDGNLGEGKTYNSSTPPYRNLSENNASFRPRSYRDIPFIHQFGVFVEDNLNWRIGSRMLKIQAGVRYDYASVVKGIFSPRVNASFDIIPDLFTIRGGYGITAKMPTLLYLYPENAYFEYVNINELANENIAEDERLFITTTKVHNVENKSLKIARNYKAEVGFDLSIGNLSLAVTAFSEHLKDGYSLNETFHTFKPFMYHEYGRDENNQLVMTGSYPVLSKYYKPTNNLFINTKGIEFDLNVGRVDAIRTSFLLNGAWMRTESGNSAYNFYDNSGSGASQRKHVAIYEPKNAISYNQRFSTALRATHNIPSIGFVVTLTAQAVWQQSDWRTFGNDSIPIGYISVEDASVHMFESDQYTTPEALTEAGYGYMLQNVSHSDAIKESYPPYFCFNVNITKEISDKFRVSFFANNMFRSYPRIESKRFPGNYITMNNRFYFGLELALTL